MNQKMSLVDHYHFLHEELKKTRKEVKKILGSRFDKKNKNMNIEKRMFLLNSRIDTLFTRKMLEVKSRIAAEEMVNNLGGDDDKSE